MELVHARNVRFLYKAILKLHRGLPKELQIIGNGYVRDEFKRHKSCTPHETELFISEWTKYAVSLAEQLKLKGVNMKQFGVQLDEDRIEQMRDDQLYQLYELMVAAKGENAIEHQ
ncbi:succinate dehydrogenase assembly factor 3, mitochondrial [Schistocerca nitens]|uniref:succinate dehydrogenase assembly factor 3, mitochondrial n=1 Tax=Schistocerca nitens TaxID=7011 RepID=UPI00211848AB|nr:succinate dehydrogenase assembly factor 3, mitochondrial [Schistocerca nitens]